MMAQVANAAAVAAAPYLAARSLFGVVLMMVSLPFGRWFRPRRQRSPQAADETSGKCLLVGLRAFWLGAVGGSWFLAVTLVLPSPSPEWVARPLIGMSVHRGSGMRVL